MSDRVLSRLLYEPEQSELTPIAWPDGLAPTPITVPETAHGELNSADVLVVTWTSAEHEALADVLSPGRLKEDWAYYTHEYAAYEEHLTWKSPARTVRCLGEFQYVTIGAKRVCLFHSQLHLATDDDTAPIVDLWQQIIAEVDPSLIITTGTAGGIGATEVLGDVFVVQGAKFNCTKTFKDKSWAQQHFGVTDAVVLGANFARLNDLIAINADRLPHEYAPRMPVAYVGGDVETVDYFAFDDTDDSYGIVADDADAKTEEMDDATLPLALSLMGRVTQWLSVRNASDPRVPSSIGDLEAQAQWASDIYEKYGYTTTLGSAITCWALIADL